MAHTVRPMEMTKGDRQDMNKFRKDMKPKSKVYRAYFFFRGNYYRCISFDVKKSLTDAFPDAKIVKMKFKNQDKADIAYEEIS